MVVGDLPFMSYQASLEDGVRNAGRLVKEGGAHAVKLEGLQPELVHRLTEIGIPVMAHVGLTPQSVYGLGGYKVQGRGEAAQKVLEQAHQLEKAGAFARRAGGAARRPGRRDHRRLADPHDRDRRRPRRRCTGAGHQRSLGTHREATEAGEGLRRSPGRRSPAPSSHSSTTSRPARSPTRITATPSSDLGSSGTTERAPLHSAT